MKQSQVGNKSDDPLLTAVETANYLGIKPETLNTWRCTRRYSLPFVRVGRAIRYRLSAVESFLASRTVCGDAQQKSDR
jgi:excisionase family DNA binding protein